MEPPVTTIQLTLGEMVALHTTAAVAEVVLVRLDKMVELTAPVVVTPKAVRLA